MLLTHTEETLTCTTDFINPKLLSLMQMCIQDLNFKANVVIITIFTIGLQKYCIRMKFLIHICIELKNLVFLKSVVHVNVSSE